MNRTDTIKLLKDTKGEYFTHPKNTKTIGSLVGSVIYPSSNTGKHKPYYALGLIDNQGDWVTQWMVG